MWLRQSTASQEILLGAFLDSTDGNTAETGLTIANTDIKLWKEGATTEANKNSGGATHIASGRYYAVLDATDSNTLGKLEINVHVAGALAVRREFMVVPAMVYDSLILGTDDLDVNVLKISDGATAADNLELQYDTTGLSGDTFPSTQAQVGNLATGSSAISTVAESDTVTTGTEVNTFAVTDVLDGVHHEISDVAGVMELYYQFDVGGNGVASIVEMTGRLNGGNDSIGVYAYNWGGAAWDQIGTMVGSGSTTDGVSNFNLLTRHTGTGANLGKVRVRGYAASGLTTATLYIDQAFVSYAVIAQSVGYANGAIWYDSNASNTNTEVYVDGTADNPVSTEAAVNTLIASTGLTRVEVAIDSTITFATSHTSEYWTGEHWTAALGGQDFSGAHFFGADVTGIGTGTTAIDFEKCRIGTCTLHQFHMVDCGFDGTLTMGEAGNYVISGGHSAIAGSTTPIIDTGAALANVNLTMPHYHNGTEIRNLNATGTDLFSISGMGQIIYAASCSGTVNQRGLWKVTNTGGVTITKDDDSASIDAIEADTNELQTDWTNGGRLDLIIDATLADTADMQPRVSAIEVDTSTTLPALIDDLAIKKNTAFSNFEFLMVLTSDHVTPATGLTVTGQRSIDGGAFAAVSGSIAEVSNGIYQFDALAADTNGDVITWRFSSGTADDTFVTFKTIQ